MIEIEKSSGNVYADLSTPNAAEMLVKAQLASKIGEIIKSRKWTQLQAAEVLGMLSRNCRIGCAANFVASARRECWIVWRALGAMCRSS